MLEAEDFGREGVRSVCPHARLTHSTLFRDNAICGLTGRDRRKSVHAQGGQEHIEHLLARQRSGGGDRDPLGARFRMHDKRVARHRRHVRDKGGQLDILEIQDVPRRIRRRLIGQGKGRRRCCENCRCGQEGFQIHVYRASSGARVWSIVFPSRSIFRRTGLGSENFRASSAGGTSLMSAPSRPTTTSPG